MILNIVEIVENDTRAGVGLRPDGPPDIVWCDVPNNGKWIYQDAKHKPLLAFCIAKYPVTYK